MKEFKSKKIVRIVAIVLSVISIVFFALSCQGCKRSGNSKESWKGVHDYTATLTDKAFVKNGATEYILIVPENTSQLISIAKDEFIDLFKAATGISIKLAKDIGLTHDATGKFISLGETTLLETSGLTINKGNLTKDGVRILTKDNNIYLVGGSDYGTINAVYTFMKVTFNYEYFYSNCVQIDKNVKDLNLFDYNITDIPDMRDRNGGWFWQLRVKTAEYHSQMAYRFRLAGGGSRVFELPVYSDYDPSKQVNSSVHNTNSYLPKNVYYNEHPGWYTTITTEGGKQLCYTARGDANEFELMAQEVAKKIIYSLTLNTPETHPYINHVIIGMEDTYDSCACDKCVELKEYYGTESGAVCIFVNRVSEIVEEWLNDPENAAYYREEFYIMLLAYNNSIDAPVKYDDKNGCYVPIDEKVDLRDNVGVYYADIKQDYQSSLFGDVNANTRKNLEGWAALTDRLDHYVYAIDYKNYMVPYDCFNYFTADMYRYYMEIGSTAYYICAYGGYENPFETNWTRLRLYLNANLLWDCSIDEEVYIDRYFQAMYGEAADVMRSMFEEQRVHMAKICTENELYVQDSIFLILNRAEYFPKNTLKTWMNRCDEALKIVEKYKNTDPEYYEMLLNNIEAEYIAPAWMCLYLHHETMLVQEKEEIKARIFETLELLGVEDMSLTESGNTTVRNSLTNI